jgi:protein ImuB
VHADHRPEYAQKTQPASLQVNAGASELPTLSMRRPLWLLPEPLPLTTAVKPPTSLHLMQGPERIEAGWWNDAPLKRDYYVATQGQQSCWVFKDLMQSSGWYVHGWFG